MYKALISLFVIFSYPLYCYPCVSYIPPEQLVMNYDVIVAGELRDIKTIQYGKEKRREFGQAQLHVNQWLWGKTQHSSLLMVTWRQSTDLCLSIDYSFWATKNCIWLLRENSNGELELGIPGALVELGSIQAVNNALHHLPFGIRIDRYYSEADKQVTVTLLFRNTSMSELRLPTIKLLGDTLALSSGVHIRLMKQQRDGEPIEVKPLSEAIISVENLPPFILQPNEETRLELNLRNYFDLEPFQYYLISLVVDGVGESTPVEFTSL